MLRGEAIAATPAMAGEVHMRWVDTTEGKGGRARAVPATKMPRLGGAQKGVAGFEGKNDGAEEAAAQQESAAAAGRCSILGQEGCVQKGVQNVA